MMAGLLTGSGLLQTGCRASPVSTIIPSSGVPRRIISLAPSVTEVLFALGAGPQVIACTRYCNYPPQARRLPKVGDVHLDFEEIVALAPDLVVAESITSDSIERRLQSLGLRVVRVDSTTLEGYMQTLRTLGWLTGHRVQAQTLAGALRARIRALQAATARIPLRLRRRVFVEIWGRPLQTAGAGTFLDEMISLVGGVNIFHDVRDYPRVSAEAVVIGDPQVVVLTTEKREEFVSWPPFSALSAVRSGSVYSLDPDTLVRPTPRLLRALDELARIVSP